MKKYIKQIRSDILAPNTTILCIFSDNREMTIFRNAIFVDFHKRLINTKLRYNTMEFHNGSNILFTIAIPELCRGLRFKKCFIQGTNRIENYDDLKNVLMLGFTKKPNFVFMEYNI